MTSKKAPVEFIQKIKSKMEEQNLGVSQLARKIGVSHPTIIELVTHGKKPSFDTCLALAKWLNEPDVLVLREAGLLPPGPSDKVRFEDLKEILEQLPEEDVLELKQIAKWKLQRKGDGKPSKSLKSK
jgi:transcriptional regulator with XRE-family HTH domain